MHKKNVSQQKFVLLEQNASQKNGRVYPKKQLIILLISLLLINFLKKWFCALELWTTVLPGGYAERGARPRIQKGVSCCSMVSFIINRTTSMGRV